MLLDTCSVLQPCILHYVYQLESKSFFPLDQLYLPMHGNNEWSSSNCQKLMLKFTDVRKLTISPFLTAKASNLMRKYFTKRIITKFPRKTAKYFFDIIIPETSLINMHIVTRCPKVSHFLNSMIRSCFEKKLCFLLTF